jgi:hypothetical protein
MNRSQFGELEEQVVLALLRLEGESYAVPVADELERPTGREVWAPAPLLSRGHRAGDPDSQAVEAS